MYCDGQYILHLDSDSVLYVPITYDHMFHLSKPVLPFRRYREDTPLGKAIAYIYVQQNLRLRTAYVESAARECRP